MNKLNSIELKIDFTFENKTNNISPLLDIMLKRTNDDLQLKVYRKSTIKNDLINCYSHHCSRIKSEIIKNTKNLQYLPEEEIYNKNTFKNLQYRYYFIHMLSEKYAKSTTRKIIITPTTTLITIIIN